MFGRGDEDRVHVLERQQVFHVFEVARRPSVIVFVCGHGPLAVHLPEVAHRGHLDVVRFLQAGRDPVELSPAVANADMAERDALVRAEDAAVRKRGGADGGARCKPRGLVQELSPIDFVRRWFLVAHGFTFQQVLVGLLSSPLSPRYGGVGGFSDGHQSITQTSLGNRRAPPRTHFKLAWFRF